MLLWPAVTLIGFVLLTVLVITMAAQSTARYEQEKRAGAPGGRSTAAEPVGATTV